MKRPPIVGQPIVGGFLFPEPHGLLIHISNYNSHFN